MIGDFSSESEDCCSNDLTNFEDSELDFLTSQFGLSQKIIEPNHIPEHSKSCID